MENRLKQNLIDLGVKKGDQIGIAVSGGVDSMVLLYCILRLRDEMGISVAAYHMEHGIRAGSSQQDMDFVVDTCEDLGVPCIVKRVDVPAFAKKEGLSLEMAARIERYAFLDSQGADYIATAHHMDDVAETVIMNLIRGSGLAGLCGIPRIRGRYIRPMLDISRQEIEQYAQKNHITYAQDETNNDITYTRNYIRKEIFAANEKSERWCV